MRGREIGESGSLEDGWAEFWRVTGNSDWGIGVCTGWRGGITR